jgi:hypothetical protein
MFSLCTVSRLLANQREALAGEIAISVGAVLGVIVGFYLFLRGFKLLS